MNTEIRKSVLKGITVKSDGMKVELSSGKVNIACREIIIKSPVIFQIEPLGIKEIKNENHEATRDSNVSFFHPCKLKECCMEGFLNLMPGILVPGSVIVKSSSGVIYQLDTDYKVSEKWPCVWISSDESGTSRIKDKQEIFVDYKYSMARIDTIFVSKDGDIKLQKGIEKRESPKPDELDKDCIPMINIYLPFNINNITERNIYPVGRLPVVTEKEVK